MQRRRRGQSSAPNSQNFIPPSQPAQVPFEQIPVEGGVLRERLFESANPAPYRQDAADFSIPAQPPPATMEFPLRSRELPAQGIPHFPQSPIQEEPEAALDMQEDLSDFIYADQSYTPNAYQDHYAPEAYAPYVEEEIFEEDIDAQIEQEIRDERAKTIYFFLNLAGSIVGLVLIFLLMAVVINLFNWLRADLQNILRYLGF